MSRFLSLKMVLYPYQALGHAGETRLLTIKRADFASTIHCSLSHVFLHSRPTYEALSYTWNSTNPVTPPALDTEIKVALYGDTIEAFKVQPYRELQNDPDTAAVYYQSGGSHHQQAILCDGIEVFIGGELHAALKRLRYEDQPRVLWVDALCINQNDFEERKEHVQLMGEIYARATQVVIWLGEGVAANVQAFRALEAGGIRLLELQKHESRPEMVKAKFLSDPEMRRHHWDALGDLLRNTWFERVWVIQEVVNASKAQIMIGGATWPWEHFSSLVHAFRDNDVDVLLQGRGKVTAIAAVGLIFSLGGKERVLQSLLDILRGSRYFKSTLPHDKFYAILGLASDVTDELVPVDYSMDASTVYTKFAISHMRKHQALDVLYCCVKSGTRSVLNLPSWVPDWTQPCHHQPFSFGGLNTHAAGDSKTKIRFESNNRSLFVLGKIVDRIQAVEQLRRIPREGYGDRAQKGFIHAHLPKEQRDQEMRNIWRSHHSSWMKDNQEASRQWFSNAMEIAFPDKVITADAYENLWRTFVCNKTFDRATPPASWGQHFSDFMMSIKHSDEDHRQALRDTWVKEAEDPYDLRETFGDANSYQGRTSLLWEFNISFGRWCFNRRFYRTVAGRFGWAPDSVQAGDEISVLYGGPVPLVLRPDNAGHHEVIGDCYLHGFMGGEAMDNSFEELEIYLI